MQHGFVWYRSKSRPAIEPFSGAYQSAVIGTCERCTFRVPDPYFCGVKVGLGMASESVGAASKRLHSNVLVLRRAQHSRAWPGACSGRDYDANVLGRKKQDRKGISKVRAESTITRRALRDGKDESRNGSTETSEAWFDSMALFEAGEY